MGLKGITIKRTNTRFIFSKLSTIDYDFQL